MSMLSFSAGGINVADIVGGLMDAERMALTNIERRKGDVNLQVAALNTITDNLGELRTQALALTNTSFSKLAATSSSSAVTATLGTSASTGSISFTVQQVAQAHGLRTAGSVATSSSVITNEPLLAISSATGALGIGGVRAGAGLAAGDLQVTVTQASAGATRVGTAAPAGTTVIDGSNDTLSLEIDGVAHSVTLAHQPGGYTTTGLVDAVNAAFDADGVGAVASLDATGRMRVTGTHEGSQATLQITGGSALGALGLGVDASAVTGTDGIITVDGQDTVVTSARAGEAVAVDTGAGTLDVTLSGGLRIGDAKVAVVSTGDGSLASVASAINAAKVGVGASAVRMSEGAWVLQLSAATTGSAGAIAVDANAFAGLGGFVETSEARDATIRIGSGAGAYDIVGTGNSFSDVLPGVVLTTNAVSTTPVTVGVNRDENSTVNAVKQLVEKANVLFAQIANQTRFDPDTRVSGPLSGQSAVRSLATDLLTAVTNMVPVADGLASNVGITSTRNGRLEFDEAKFRSALAADPEAVARLFGNGGSSATGSVSFGRATEKTVAGEYEIVVTQAATRADSGAVLTGGLAGTQQLSVRVGDTVVNFETLADATTAEVADGLRAALAAGGLDLDVEVTGDDVAIRARKFGVGGSFEFGTVPGVWTTAAGQDVMGTIDGVAAIGVGNSLRLTDVSTSNARGLQVSVDEGFTGTTDLTVEPGIAARVAALGTRLTGENGSLTLTGKGLDDRLRAFNTQIDRFEERMERMELRLVRQWSSIQTMLQSLQSQGDWLGSQISSMNQQPAR